MNILRYIFNELRARGLRTLNRRCLVFADGGFQAWFGFTPKSLQKSLASKGIGGIPMNRPAWNASNSDVNLSKQTVESLLRYPVCIEMESTLHELLGADPQSIESARTQHAEQITKFAAQINRAIEVSDPAAVAVVQGYDTFQAVARELALQNNLAVIAFENTALKDRLLWDDHSALTTNRNLASNFYWRHLDTADSLAVDTYVNRLVAETKQRKQEEHASPEQRFNGSRPNRPTVLFLGQVYTDSSVLFGIRDWKTPVHLMLELARRAVKMDFNLWIKLHPKEIKGASPVTGKAYNKLTYRKLTACPEFRQFITDTDRVMIDHENTYDTYDLISKADAAVTLSSQAGLEAAIRGVPSVVAGQAYYGGLGFTLDADCPEVLEIELGRALGMSDESKAERRLAARIFTHIYFERYCITKSPDAVAQLVAKRCFGLTK